MFGKKKDKNSKDKKDKKDKKSLESETDEAITNRKYFNLSKFNNVFVCDFKKPLKL